MTQLKCKLDLNIDGNGEVRHYAIEADDSDKEYRVAINGSKHTDADERESPSFKPLVFDVQKFSTKGDAVAYIKNQVQRLLDAAFEPPPIKL